MPALGTTLNIVANEATDSNIGFAMTPGYLAWVVVETTQTRLQARTR